MLTGMGSDQSWGVWPIRTNAYCAIDTCFVKCHISIHETMILHLSINNRTIPSWHITSNVLCVGQAHQPPAAPCLLYIATYALRSCVRIFRMLLIIRNLKLEDLGDNIIAPWRYFDRDAAMKGRCEGKEPIPWIYLFRASVNGCLQPRSQRNFKIPLCSCLR